MRVKRCYARLSKKQRAVIEDIVKKGLTEYEAIEQNNARGWNYRRWLASGHFRRELNNRIEAELRQKLWSILRTAKGVSARKACLELISFLKADAEDETKGKIESEDELSGISDEKASRMLAILAED